LINVAREHGDTRKQGVQIQLPLTHEDLSFLTGSHHVTITKAIKRFEKAGKIVKEGRTYILPAAMISSESTGYSPDL
jgi:CRP-like cAMP-binding protein